jgi:uncharacterized membrane protein YozB (DUF420 family)
LRERWFYTGMMLALMAALLLGFARTFFLSPWFPEARVDAAPEPFFLVHGVFFAAWFLLLAVQVRLIASRNVAAHRRLGWVGAGLAAVMIVFGVIGGVIAARRPTGFVNVPLPSLQFLIVPLGGLALFALFVGLAVAWRRDVQSHKRLMLLATIAIAEAAIVRWPLDVMDATSPIPYLGPTELFTLLFLVPMLIWDVVSRGRPHRVTVLGGLLVAAELAFRIPIGATGPWLAFAGWLVGSSG